ALDLDEDVNVKLTSWKVPESQYTKDQKVTLRRLLSHTAATSVSGYWGYAQGEPLPRLIDVLDGRSPANSKPVRVTAVPGSTTQYSGGGYLIVQQLVIDVSGQSFEDYMAEAVLKPLGMSQSTFEQPLPADRRKSAATGN